MFVCPECGTLGDKPGFCTEDGAALAPRSDPLLGQILGSYRITRLIGRGGMGSVYRCVQPQIGSRVALKVLSPECAQDPTLVERFFAEARAVNLIRHERIVNVLDLARLPDCRPYIIMEYLDGEPLSDLIGRRGPLPIATFGKLMREVLDALAAAHGKGIVHRDLKPDNVYVTPSGHAKVLDFGIAKLQPEIAQLDAATRTGSLLGTPFYMSPEQALARPVDARSDLYAVGVILFEGLTGRKPFYGTTLYEVLKQQIEQAPPSSRALRPDLPPALEALVQRALEKNPAHRFQSAEELAAALDHAIAGAGQDAWAPLIAPGSAKPMEPAPPAAPTPATAPSPGAGWAPAASSAGFQPVAATAPPHVSMAGYSHYGAPEQRAPDKTSSARLPLLVAGGCAAVVVLGALAGGGLFWLSTNARKELPAPSPTSAPQDTAGRLGAPPDDDVGAGSLDFDRKRFDVAAFLPRAERLAKQHFADAKLIRIDAMGINRAGIVDLTARSQNMAMYRFRSPAASKAPPDFPENAKYEANCVVYVIAMQMGLQTQVSRWTCDDPLLAAPRCTPAQIWQRAEQRGAPKGNLIGMLGYWADESSSTPRWYVNIEPSFTTFVPDDCSG